MSFRDFLYRKAEENAHNETLAFLTVILGALLLVGGLLVTITVLEEPNWLFLFPYQPLSNPSAFLALNLTLTGFVLISAGFILAIYYGRNRSWFISELEKSTLFEKNEEAS